MVTVSDILERLPDRLAELAGAAVRRARRVDGADLMLRVGPHLVAVAGRADSRAGSVSQAAQSALAAVERAGRDAIALVAVPYMGEVGRNICQREGVSFIDLSGNADIQAPGLRIHIAGQPNQFIRRGRPPSVFAPKSSRISRLLLLDPTRWWRQAELAQESQLGPGYVSKICRRMEGEHLVERDDAAAVRPRDPNLLLEAWRGQYDFSRHSIREGHVSARTGEELLQRFRNVCDDSGCSYAVTGLPAAWLLAPFAGFRLVTVYLRAAPSKKLLAHLKWHEEKRGANLWLVQPNDEGVFHGAEQINGVACVSPVQAFLDLKAMPERAEEAAEQLRKERLQWR